MIMVRTFGTLWLRFDPTVAAQLADAELLKRRKAAVAVFEKGNNFHRRED